jgi:apolipoprotein N-acyltransferase
MAELAYTLDTPLLVGAPVELVGPSNSQVSNSAVMVARSGKILGRYDKMHLVLFGEYLPFADWFPWLYRLSPLCASCTPGERPKAYTAGSLRIAPDICYESVLSHVIRGQVNALKAEDREPDVLVNLTNDGWFWGSSELDMHLRCGVFRAVECRKPLLIAANTGFSAVIDGDGRVLQQGPRRKTWVLLAEVAPDGRHSWYLEYGDWPAGCCLAVCVLLGFVGAGGFFARRNHPIVGF